MSVTRKHARHKLPVQLFYDNPLKLIDFSLGGAGAELGNINPDSGSTLKLVLIFPTTERMLDGNFS